jgi:hypothetical protein
VLLLRLAHFQLSIWLLLVVVVQTTVAVELVVIGLALFPLYFL